MGPEMKTTPEKFDGWVASVRTPTPIQLDAPRHDF
jgi:hypothetical protein